MVQSYLPGGANVPSHMGTLAPPGEYDWTCVSFGPSESTTPNGQSIGSAVSAQLMAECLYTLQWATLSPKIFPSHGESGPLSSSWFLGPIQAHNPNSISITSAVFAQITAEFPCTLQWDTHFPLQNCPFPWWDLDRHLWDGSLGPPKSSTQTASRQVKPFLQGSLVCK